MASKYLPEFSKQRRRIKRFVTAAQKRGYRFPKGTVPDVPKRITKKTVEKLQALSPKELYKKATYYDPVHDVLVPGEVGRMLERQKASKKAAKALYAKRTQSAYSEPGQPPNDVDDVLRWVEDKLLGWDVEKLGLKSYEHWKRRIITGDKNTLQRIFDGAIARDGRRVVAQRLQSHATAVNEKVTDILFSISKREEVASELVWFATLIKGEALTEMERMRASVAEVYFSWEGHEDEIE